MYSRWILILNSLIVVTSQSYYSVVAPGLLKSNRKYNVIVSLHEAREQAAIKVAIVGPLLNASQTVFLQPFESINVAFHMPNLKMGSYKLIAEGISGIAFRNETFLNVNIRAGPKIYIQTDKAIYKPGDEMQLRVLFLDEHTRPLQIKEPIRIEIIDGKQNRVKQFKDISLIAGIFTGKFQLSQYPVMGIWRIRAYISGRYDFTETKTLQVTHYVLPKFSVYIKMDPHFVTHHKVLRAQIYGKYTFDKYVEGNATAVLRESFSNKLLQEKQLYIKDRGQVAFQFDTIEQLAKVYGVTLYVFLAEKHTGLTQSDKMSIEIHHQSYNIVVDPDSIRFKDTRPYLVKVLVQHWNATKIGDRTTPVKMTHGTKDYQAYLDRNGEALFEFDHDPLADHTFTYKDSTYILPNIYADESVGKNRTDSHCRLQLKGDRPRLGVPIDVDVVSIEPIPYIVYSVIAHAGITETYNIRVPPNQNSYRIRIIPTIEMVTTAFLYVYYVRDGMLHYDEMKLELPQEFENKVRVLAPKQVEPGQLVNLQLHAQPGSTVGVLAVDLGVFLLDASYDLQRGKIMSDLANDRTYLPFPALVYPGVLSGVVTLTNAHYEFVSSQGHGIVASASAVTAKFRTQFPETWIFQNYEIKTDITQLSLTIPDAITTWRITAFTVHNRTGFGMVDGPTDVTTLQPFFINLNLPYAVKRGEIVTIPVILYNYHAQFLDTEIIFYNNNKQFDFMESNIFAGFRKSENSYSLQRVNVPANGVERVKFYITPKEVGQLNLTLVARNTLASDAIVQQLKVEPEGNKEHHNVPLYISVQPDTPFSTSLATDIPRSIVPLSEYITLSVGGNTLVPTLKNLNGLVLLPTGCGEQNMVNFAPNVLVLQYLLTSGMHLKEKEVVTKAKQYIEMGYQQQLSYRHANGGYSVFGERKDEEPSTWLTAYVIRYFLKASRYLAIESHIIDSGLEYISQNQRSDGSFDFTGYLFFPAQQNRYGFTAFVLMTFLEQRNYANKYKNTIDKGLQYLNENINRVDDTYALAIMAACLQMAKHSSAQVVYDKLQPRQQRTADTIWWTQSDSNLEKDVEITAYILMALLDTDGHNTNDVLAIFKWLTQQRNERGGFKSTHDTVVGLQALVKFSEKYEDRGNTNIKLKYKAKNLSNAIIKIEEFAVDVNNKMILQTSELPRSARFIDIEAAGMGHSLLQLSYHYHVLGTETSKHFLVKVTPTFLNSEELLLDICCTPRAPDGANLQQLSTTNMIIMEIHMPSGFTSSDEFSNDLLAIEIVERVESRNDETTLVIYFKKLEANVEYCYDVLATKLHEVAMRKPALISVYDYYNISRHDAIFYSV